MTHGLALVVSFAKLLEVPCGILDSTSCIFDNTPRVDCSGSYIVPRIRPESNIPSSDACILLLLVQPFQGLFHSVGVLPVPPTVSCLAVVAMRHIGPLHHHFVGIVYRVSREPRGAAPH
jgi:hypothetical protein